MFRRRLLRTLAVLVVSLALTTPLCEAASRGRASRISPASAHLGILEWVTNLWAKNGCSLDPGGLCAPNPTSHSLPPVPSGSSLEEGCSIDPGGRTCGGHS
jgi:hypothetical protein